jgi:putative ABC transport system permease protein
VSGVFYLAWRYLAWHRFKTTVLVAAITLVIFLPSGLQILIDRTAQDMTARAMTTPLLLGARGSPVELTLNSLYFSQGNPTAVSYEELEVLSRSGLVEPIPLYVRFRSRGHAIVGTSLDYFEFRGLRIAEGRPLVRLGEAVLGAAVAQTQNLQVGDFVVSSPETLFDLAGVYPLKMPVVGILAPSYTSDDQAIFIDLKTSWVISGLGHGHQDLDNPAAAAAVLAVEENRIIANAALVQYNEITDDNRSSFHFHGDLSGYPLSAILPVSASDKSKTLILGRYQDHPALQMIEPGTVMDNLLDTVFTVQKYVLVAMGMVAVATAAVVVLVFVLSLRLRRGEMLTMARLGGARIVVSSLMLAEVTIVLLIAVVCAGLLGASTLFWGDVLINSLVLQA